MKMRRRCAVYTRKSTDEGLDQDFNSLDAQRDACEAYIKSQAGEGWTLMKARYDDGGFSGGSLERPALQRLLADIRNRKVDVVVVYKVDRLTRSLSDFARIVEILDTQGVSFVSVTQQFNTTSSMGRLTLNVLLSFAQFEREVTAERIRDKIAASKKKGLWMGGVVPLGYDVVDRKLVVNAGEAKTVQTLFDLYTQLGTVKALKEEADRLGLRTKSRKPNNGSRAGGSMPFTIGHLHKLLTNRVYIGEISHKGNSYPGEQAPIIERAAWDAVQAQLAANAQRRARGVNGKGPHLLTGLLYDGDGKRIAPHHCNKQGRRYHYYVTRDLDARTGWRLPAGMIETAVIDGIAAFLQDGRKLIDALGSAASAQDVPVILKQAAHLTREMQSGDPAEQRAMLRNLVARVEVTQERVRIALHADALRARLDIAAPDSNTGTEPSTLHFDLPVSFKRRGVETKLVIGGGTSGIAPDRALVGAVLSAHRWFAELTSGDARSIRDLAARHRVDKGDVSRILPLAFLAPDIVAAILNGKQPVELTAYRLKRLHQLPPLWSDQRRVLGFA